MPHSTTKGIDSTKLEGTKELVKMIRSFWMREGYPEIDVKIERILVRNKTVNGQNVPQHALSIVSNIGPAGFPPRNGIYYK